jgi:hypothetical protein
MGQQQLLLIVLGVILVGVAVVLGIQYFGVGAEEGAKDELVAHSLTVGANAQQWFKKPAAMGGGDNTFTGFTTHYANNLTGLHTSTNGAYTITTNTATQVTITGTPDAALTYDWHIECDVFADSMATAIVPN